MVSSARGTVEQEVLHAAESEKKSVKMGGRVIVLVESGIVDKIRSVPCDSARNCAGAR